MWDIQYCKQGLTALWRLLSNNTNIQNEVRKKGIWGSGPALRWKSQRIKIHMPGYWFPIDFKSKPFLFGNHKYLAKSQDFWFQDFFLEIFKIHNRLVWIFLLIFLLFWICFITVLFKGITNLKKETRTVTRQLNKSRHFCLNCLCDFHLCIEKLVLNATAPPPPPSTVPEFIGPVFVKTSPKRSFSMTVNERFVLLFAKTGSMNSGTGYKSPVLFSSSCYLGTRPRCPLSSAM